MVHSFEQAGYKTIKLCHQDRPGYFPIDLTTNHDLDEIEEMEYKAIIHTAAWRSPDQCKDDRDGAYKLNVQASENLARIAKKKNVPLLYISTDYVFSGEQPPYTEEVTPDPVNYYGKSKFLGEKKVMEQSDKNIVLRIPFLYGIRAGLNASHLLTQTINALKSTEPWVMDHTAARYPTFTGDVAAAALYLINNKHSGIFHFSGQDRLTRYEITEIFAEIMGCPMTHIVQQLEAPATEAVRPKDSHLATQKIHQLGLTEPLPFADRIAKILFDLPI